MVVIPEVSCAAISESRQLTDAVSMSKSNFAPQNGPSKQDESSGFGSSRTATTSLVTSAAATTTPYCTTLNHAHSYHIRFYCTVLHCLLPLGRACSIGIMVTLVGESKCAKICVEYTSHSMTARPWREHQAGRVALVNIRSLRHESRKCERGKK